MSAVHTPGPWDREFTFAQIDMEIARCTAHGLRLAPLEFKRGMRGFVKGEAGPMSNGEALRLSWYAGWVHRAYAQAVVKASEPAAGVQVAQIQKGDRVRCINGTRTGYLRRGRDYVIADVAPSGYVRVEGHADYYLAAARFAALANAGEVAK